MTETRSNALTYKDYVLFPEDGKRYEIIEGELFVTPAPIPLHQRVSRKLEYIFECYVKKTNAGEVFYAPIDVVLSDSTIVQPDLLIVGSDQAAIVGEKHITGAPRLVVEICSRKSRKSDFIGKRKSYGKYGVREYWIVDYEIERVEHFLLQSGTLEKTGEFSSGETVVSTEFEGLEVDLNEIF